PALGGGGVAGRPRARADAAGHGEPDAARAEPGVAGRPARARDQRGRLRVAGGGAAEPLRRRLRGLPRSAQLLARQALYAAFLFSFARQAGSRRRGGRPEHLAADGAPVVLVHQPHARIRGLPGPALPRAGAVVRRVGLRAGGPEADRSADIGDAGPAVSRCAYARLDVRPGPRPGAGGDGGQPPGQPGAGPLLRSGVETVELAGPNVFAQRPYDIRFEWGESGLRALAAEAKVVVVVDVVSFSTVFAI